MDQMKINITLVGPDGAVRGEVSRPCASEDEFARFLGAVAGALSRMGDDTEAAEMRQCAVERAEVAFERNAGNDDEAA